MISVCIATYNGESYIREQIESVLPQLSSIDEVIVSDDASDDATIRILESLGDKRIKILHHEPLAEDGYPFARTTANFHHALQHAMGDFVFLCDQDDVWLPEKVSTMMREMGDAQLAVHDCRLVAEDGRVLLPSYFEHVKPSGAFLRNWLHCPFLGCCMVARRDWLLSLLPFPTMQVPHDLWLGTLAGHNIRFVNQVLSNYRRHTGAQSSVALGNTNPLTFKIRYRMTFLSAFLRYIIAKRP